MNFPNEDVCLKSILECFRPLVDKYQYTCEITECKKFNVVVIYKKIEEDCLIEIENRTNYTDYGFGIFFASPISAFGTKSTNFRCFINIPFDKQDKECKFIQNAAKEFFDKLH